MMLQSFIQSNDLKQFLNIIIALIIGLFFGMERSYRGKVNAIMNYALVSVGFSLTSVGITYVQKNIDPFVIALLFVALILVVFLSYLYRKENLDELSCFSLALSGTISIFIGLSNYLLATFVFIISIIIYTLVYLLNIYVERRRYALTIIVEQDENILLKVLNICDENGAKIHCFRSSIILLDNQKALRLELSFAYLTSKNKVRKIFDILKEEKIINVVYHGDIHKMEWR